MFTASALSWTALHHHHLTPIEEARDGGYRVGDTAGDHQAALVDTRGVFGEQVLVGGVHPSPEDPPLAPVGVARYDEVDGVGAEVTVEILRVMAEEELESGGLAKVVQPFQVGLSPLVEQARAQSTDDKPPVGHETPVQEDRPRFLDGPLQRAGMT